MIGLRTSARVSGTGAGAALGRRRIRVVLEPGTRPVSRSAGQRPGSGPNGTGLARLTFVQRRGQADFRPDYSPDGRKIVFNHIGSDGSISVWVMRADGSGTHRVSKPYINTALAPRWGRRLVD